jgi:hypothetical protein
MNMLTAELQDQATILGLEADRLRAEQAPASQSPRRRTRPR